MGHVKMLPVSYNLAARRNGGKRFESYLTKADDSYSEEVRSREGRGTSILDAFFQVRRSRVPYFSRRVVGDHDAEGLLEKSKNGMAVHEVT